mmetsp:Transcript_4584/g.7783  ORF Transcript_4584/g.7783 Transcript_4584/m.7783 type:complete len:255 (-) Transcript_4584:24-788(-)
MRAFYSYDFLVLDYVKDAEMREICKEIIEKQTDFETGPDGKPVGVDFREVCGNSVVESFIESNRTWQLMPGQRIEILNFESKNQNYVWYQNAENCRKKGLLLDFRLGLWDPFKPVTNSFKKKLTNIINFGKTGFSETTVLPEVFTGMDWRLQVGEPGVKQMKFDVSLDTEIWQNCTIDLEIKRSMRGVLRGVPDVRFSRQIKVETIPLFEWRQFKDVIQTKYHSKEEILEYQAEENRMKEDLEAEKIKAWMDNQ